VAEADSGGLLEPDDVAALALQNEYMEWRQQQGLSPRHGSEVAQCLRQAQAIDQHWYAHDCCAAVLPLLERAMVRTQARFDCKPFRWRGHGEP